MNTPYTLLDHTADLRIRVTGSDMADLFANAGMALADLICDPQTLTAQDPTILHASGDDPADLLVNFLRELLFQFSGDERLIKAIQILDISDTALTARLATDRYTQARHTLRHEIKAVTYHQVAVEATGDGWQATVVFDI